MTPEEAVPETHTITALVNDRPGVLTRVSGLFRRRGFNISSLAVGHSEMANLSRMTFNVEGDDYVPGARFVTVAAVDDDRGYVTCDSPG